MRALTVSIALMIVTAGSAEGRQLPRDGIPPVFINAVGRIQPPEAPGGWVLQVISRGGLDGRGTGDLVISSDGALTLLGPGPAASAPPDVLRSIGQYIRTTTPSQWTAGSRLSPCSDCFATLIVLTRRESDGRLQTLTAFWDVTTQGRVAANVLRIHDLAQALRRQ